MTTPDPFNTADCYTTSRDAGEFHSTTVKDALQESGYLPDDPVTVYAYKRRIVDDGWIKDEAVRLAEELAESYDDEFGGGDEPMINDLDTIEAALIPIIRSAVAKHPPWQCEKVAERTFSAEEVRKIWEGRE